MVEESILLLAVKFTWTEKEKQLRVIQEYVQNANFAKFAFLLTIQWLLAQK